MKIHHLPKLLIFVVFASVTAVLFTGSAIAHAPYNASSESGNILKPTPSAHLPSLANIEQTAGNEPASTTYTVTLGLWRNMRPTESYLRGVSLLPPQYKVDCVSPDQKSQGWIVGDNGVILSYCNGYWDHAIIVESLPTTLYGVQAISPTLGVAVGDQGAVLMYLYDPIAMGYVWTKSPIPVGNKSLYKVSMVPNGSGGYVGWIVGEKDDTGLGTLLYGTITPGGSVNGETVYNYTWDNVTSNFPDLPQVDYYFGLQTLTPNNAWAVGGSATGGGVIIHWDGTKWSLSQLLGEDPIISLHMLTANDGWAGGFGGEIYHYNGTTWAPVASPTTRMLFGVDFSPDGEGWMVGDGGTLLKYIDGNWKLFTDLRTDPIFFYGIDFTSGHGWLVGFNGNKGIGGQILEYSEGLWLSVTIPTDNQLNDVAVVSDNDAWAVGAADTQGGTILHWDGKHWQRWYQHDLPLPGVDLYAIDMINEDNGWAAGDPLAAGQPAVFLHWDGERWAPPRYEAPVNVRVNALAMLNPNFGWAVADTGNAVAKYDGASGYWTANHTCGGLYYQLRDTTIVTATNIFGWDAWSVGSLQGVAPPTPKEYFMRYEGDCSGSYAWQPVASPEACPANPTPPDGGAYTSLYSIQMSDHYQYGGFAAGDYKNRASVYSYDSGSGEWTTYVCVPDNSPNNPSRFYSTDIIKQSGITWFGGYYWEPSIGRKVVYLAYHDALGFAFAGVPVPLNGRNIYDRPVRRIRMSSDTMGWAVGDPESSAKLSEIYQYPFPNFTLDSNPKARAVIPGSTTTYTISVVALGGYGSGGVNVDLSVSGLPNGVTYQLNPPTANSDQPSTLTLNVSPSTPPGVYNIQVQGYALFRSGDREIPAYRYVTLRLTVTNHAIYTVSPSHGVAGTLVTISGDGFGADPGVGNRSTATNHVIVAGAQMPDANVLSWGNHQITVRVPDSTVLFPHGSQFGSVTVTAGGTSSNTDFSFQLENYINQVVYTFNGGQVQVTIKGTSFGKDPGSLFRSTLFEHVALGDGWIANTSVTSWGNNSITFNIPIGTPAGYITVTSNGFESNSVYINPSLSQNTFLPLINK